ncbi:UNVERIFIED_CONTAM: site-specific recombinase XerD [Acetivibrio alkalicellulosi]
MAKRGNGEGTIVKRKDGRWMGSITTGRDITGKQKRKSVYGKTKKEVQEKLNKISMEVYQESYIEPSTITLYTWLENWLKNYKAISLKPATYDLYETLIETVIKQEIGHIKLKDIKPIHIQAFYNKLFDDGKGYATSTIQKVNNILNPAFKIAIKNELIRINPVDSVEMPKHKERQVRALTMEEQIIFLEAAKNNWYYSAFVIALDTGLRCGELLALEWDDIDLKNSEIKVYKNIVAVKDRDCKESKQKIVVQTSPKTAKSVRTIPLTQRATSTLKELKLKQQSLSNIVVCTKNGTHVFPKNLRRTFQCILKNANIEKLGLHVLRHTYATRLFEAGANPKTVSELLGHTNVSITLDTYTHVLPHQKKETVKLLDTLSI